MRSCTLLTALLLVTVISYSQSKADTEKWLVDKLNAANANGTIYIPQYGEFKDVLPGSMIFVEDNKFKIDSAFLIIMNTWKTLEKDEKNPRSTKMLWKVIAKWRYLIPLNDVIGFEHSNGYMIVKLNTKSYSIIAYNGTKKQSDTKNTVEIGLNDLFEDNLLERLNTALNHLRTFYPRSSKKELF